MRFPWCLNAILCLAFFIGYRVWKLEIAFNRRWLTRTQEYILSVWIVTTAWNFTKRRKYFLHMHDNEIAEQENVMIAFVIALREHEAINITKHVSLSANQWLCLEYFQESRIYFLRFLAAWLGLLNPKNRCQ